MIIKPRILGFICTTAHPLGCEKVVANQIQYIKSNGKFSGPKNVLIIGGSTGYGLASRIAVTYGAEAKTISVAFEKEADERRTATPGWYNTAAFEKFAARDGYYAKSINGDAFSQEIKEKTAALIKQDLGQIDLVIYSLASPRRQHPLNQQLYSSVLKPIGMGFKGKTVDPFRGEVKEFSIEPATDDEIANTVAVMGGEDWEMWIDYLSSQNLLAKNFITVAYSYLGPDITKPIYKDGTIGKAKEHLKKTADQLQKKYNTNAFVSVNKAVVTQASSAIPMVPLYISLLYKLMKEQGTHEGCIEQMQKLFKEHLYSPGANPLRDAEGFIRLDNLEMENKIQLAIKEIWPQINTQNLAQLTDIEGYRNDFLSLFGFNQDGVNYEEEIEPKVTIPSVK